MTLNGRQFEEHGIETVRPGMVTIAGRPTPAVSHVRWRTGTDIAIVPHESGGLAQVTHSPMQPGHYSVVPIRPVQHPYTDSEGNARIEHSWGSDFTDDDEMIHGGPEPHAYLDHIARERKVDPELRDRSQAFIQHAMGEEGRPKFWQNIQEKIEQGEKAVEGHRPLTAYSVPPDDRRNSRVDRPKPRGKK